MSSPAEYPVSWPLEPITLWHGTIIIIGLFLIVLAIPLIGIIPESKAVLKASNTGTPVILDELSDAGGAYQDAIARFLGEHIPMRFMQVEKKSIFRRLFGKQKEETQAWVCSSF